MSKKRHHHIAIHIKKTMILFTWSGKILTYAAMLPLNLIYFLSRIMPKKRNLWLLGAWFGGKFADNPRYIFLELLKSHPEVAAYWFTKDRRLLASLQKEGYPSVYAYSLRGIWFQLRAEAVIYTHSVRTEFTAWLIARPTKQVQTWHGTPLKKILYDDRRVPIDSLVNRLTKRLLPFLELNYDAILAASESERRLFASAFRASLEKIYVTGYPRNDYIFRSSNCGKKARDKCKSNILYMPTFRPPQGSGFPLLSEGNIDYPFIDRKLGELNAILRIKLHPVQKLSPLDSEMIRDCDNIELLNIDGDVYELLGENDVLITDYSSIFFDFLITGKPIIMAPLDYSKYMDEVKALYFDYDEISPSRPCYDWDAVVREIANVLGNTYDYTRYNLVRRRFHHHLDDASSRRVVSLIQKLCSQS